MSQWVTSPRHWPVPRKISSLKTYRSKWRLNCCSNCQVCSLKAHALSDTHYWSKHLQHTHTHSWALCLSFPFPAALQCKWHCKPRLSNQHIFNSILHQGCVPCIDILVFTYVAMEVTLKQHTAVCIAKLKQSFEVYPSSPGEKAERCFKVCVVRAYSCLAADLLRFNAIIDKQACVKAPFFPLFLLSHIFTNSHIDSFSFPHCLSRTPLHTRTRPHGEWCLHKCPLLPLSLILSSLPWLVFRHAGSSTLGCTCSLPPLFFSSLPLHFSCAASPWQRGKRPPSLASSVTEWGVLGTGVAVACSEGQSVRRVAGAAGLHNMPTQGGQGIAGLASATITPLEPSLNVRGTGTERAAVTQWAINMNYPEQLDLRDTSAARSLWTVRWLQLWNSLQYIALKLTHMVPFSVIFCSALYYWEPMICAQEGPFLFYLPLGIALQVFSKKCKSDK